MLGEDENEWIVCCRRATRSDADRNGGTYFILQLSFGVSDHFVHIVDVNERRMKLITVTATTRTIKRARHCNDLQKYILGENLGIFTKQITGVNQFIVYRGYYVYV